MSDIVWGCSDNGNLVHDAAVSVITRDNPGIVDATPSLSNH